MQSLMGSRQLFVAICSIAFLLFGCDQKSFDSKGELLNYLNEESNGYIQNKSVNGVDFNLAFRPTDILISQEINNNSTTEDIEISRQKYSEYLYFNLSLSKDNQELLSVIPKNRVEFGTMVKELAFGMNDKVHLFTQNKDTLDLVDFVYPRLYGFSKATTIMFVFHKDEELLKDET